MTMPSALNEFRTEIHSSDNIPLALELLHESHANGNASEIEEFQKEIQFGLNVELALKLLSTSALRNVFGDKDLLRQQLLSGQSIKLREKKIFDLIRTEDPATLVLFSAVVAGGPAGSIYKTSVKQERKGTNNTYIQ